jgi:ABC-type amino acid transport substrate-binding protein
MVKSYTRRLVSAVAFLYLTQVPSFAADPMTYIYNGPESSHDVRYLYEWEILRTALEKTRDKYGPYRMMPSVTMSERRQVFELKNATGKLTVIYLDTTQEHERELLPIRIPVDKNLVGFRIFLIRKEDQSKFYAIKSLADLKKFTVGLGSNWSDVGIYRANGFKVITGSSYDGLFDMLINKRFDIFSRGANEVIDEYAERKNQMPDLHIEETMMLCCPMPMYFWFSKTAEGRRLAARAEEGMRMMIKDGTYDGIFKRYYGRTIKRLNLKERRIFRINNPFLVPETPLSEERLWFDPQTYK